MGWIDSHLHEFIVGDTSYTEPDPEMEFGRSKNEGRFHYSIKIYLKVMTNSLRP